MIAVESALKQFGTIDALVNRAGIVYTKPSTDLTVDDLISLVSTSLMEFLCIAQRAVKHRHERRIIRSGVGHYLPHEGPEAFAKAVLRSSKR